MSNRIEKVWVRCPGHNPMSGVATPCPACGGAMNDMTTTMQAEAVDQFDEAWKREAWHILSWLSARTYWDGEPVEFKRVPGGLFGTIEVHCSGKIGRAEVKQIRGDEGVRCGMALREAIRDAQRQYAEAE